jgi:hypothetical protein
MKIAQIFGLFPIDMNSRNPQSINFKWRSLRTVFSLIFVIGSFLTSILLFKKQLQSGPLTANNVVGIIFFGSCFLMSVLFFKLSQNWRRLMMIFTKTESHFQCTKYRLPSTVFSLRKKILICTILYLTSSFLEHIFYISSEIHSMLYDINYCNMTDIDVVEVYITRHLRFIVENLPFRYNHPTGLFLEYLNISYTFFWNFLDLFIILNSIGIAFLFENVNRRLQNYRGLLLNETLWAEIRFHHVQITELLRCYNKLLGEAVVFASFVDGYFILVQLLNITK